uniref:Myosin light chain kinase, smooth muscle n=1 Tax=Lygus hesperus TaxID=30085 RepID=A0A0A9YHP2_LYGHE
MRTAHFILVALLSGCVAFDGHYFGKRLLDIINALRKVNDASKKNLHVVTSDSVHSGSRGLMTTFETVAQALSKMDGFLSALETGAKAVPFPSVQQASHFLPMIRTFIKAGHDTIDSVVKAQKGLAGEAGSNSTAVRDLTGSLGHAKKMVSSLMGMFKKLKPSGGSGFADNLKEFAVKSPVESETPEGNDRSQGIHAGLGTASNLGNLAPAPAKDIYGKIADTLQVIHFTVRVVLCTVQAVQCTAQAAH